MVLQQQTCRSFSFAEIQSATNNFDDALIIGEGGFGKVYKGVIGPVTVAIKRLNPTSKQGGEEFQIEIELLSKFRHCHIVSLIGYCDNSNEMAIVYEYMAHGTLADHLHRKIGNNSFLTWVQRLNICIGAARGLQYLHTGTGVQQRVIHRDVKSSNILLDENWAARVSDFGLSKIGPANQDHTDVSTMVKGTFGYLDPEYYSTHRLTSKSDVYSFGVVLLEVLCGRQALDSKLQWEERSLARWGQCCIKDGTVCQIIDLALKWEILPNSLTTFVELADQCLHQHPKKRPTMSEVVARLELALAFQERTDSSIIIEDDFFYASGDYENQDSPNGGQNDGTIRLDVQSGEQINRTIRLADVRGVHIDRSIGLDDESGQESDGSSGHPDKPIHPSSSYSHYPPPIIEEPSPSSCDADDDDDDDPLPAVEDLKIAGYAFPGLELLAYGYSIYGTSCNFEWVRYLEDGSVNYIVGAKQPNHLVNADDVDAYLAVEVQPVDNRKRKGEVVKVFANDHRKITCDPVVHDHIHKTLYKGHASYRVSLPAGYLDIWKPTTLAIKREGYSIKGVGYSTGVLTKKFSPTTVVTIPYGNPTQFIISSGGIKHLLRVDDNSQDISCSRDSIVLTMRLFISRISEKKKGKKMLGFFSGGATKAQNI